MREGLLATVATPFLFAAALAHPASGGAVSASAQRGRQLFVEKGCYACHGYNGQGAVTGSKLAPDPIDLEAMKGFIRNARPTTMPAYSERLLSDAEAADIHAWLLSQPRTTAPERIPALAL